MRWFLVLLLSTGCLHDLPEPTGGSVDGGADTPGTDTPNDQGSDWNGRDIAGFDAPDGGTPPPVAMGYQLGTTIVLTGADRSGMLEAIIGNGTSGGILVTISDRARAYPIEMGDMLYDVAVSEATGIIVGGDGQDGLVARLDGVGPQIPDVYGASDSVDVFLATDLDMDGWAAVGNRDGVDGILVYRETEPVGAVFPDTLLRAVALTPDAIYIGGQSEALEGVSAFVARIPRPDVFSGVEWEFHFNLPSGSRVESLTATDMEIIGTGTTGGVPFLFRFSTDHKSDPVRTLVEPVSSGAVLRSVAATPDAVWFSGSDASGNGGLVEFDSPETFRSFPGLGPSFVIATDSGPVLFSVTDRVLIRQPLTMEGVGACTSNLLANGGSNASAGLDRSISIEEWIFQVTPRLVAPVGSVLESAPPMCR